MTDTTIPAHLHRRRSQLRELYGFDFPDDLFRFWDFATRLRPLEPLLALDEALHIHLAGPFEVLAGRFDRHTPRYSPLLHWRYYLDPPEFFTVLVGDTDGLHWGYYLDDPRAGEGCLASYYAQDALELSVEGDTLFEAVRLHLEQLARDCEDYRSDDPEHAAEYQASLEELGQLRRRLVEYATSERPETGDAYVDRYQGRSRRRKRVVAATQDGMGIVVPAEQYRPLSLKDRRLWDRLWKRADPLDLIQEARQALAEGFPGTALKLGKDLWAIHANIRSDYAWDLLDEAYAALDREVLRDVLQAHRAGRDRPWLDVLHPEDEEG
jgi:hypothetical protein